MVGTFTPRQTPEGHRKLQGDSLSWRFLKIFFSEGYLPKTLWSRETSALQRSFSLSQLCELPQHLGPQNSFFPSAFGFLGFIHRNLHVSLTEGLLLGWAMRNYGVYSFVPPLQASVVLGGVFCPPLGLSQLQFSPESQLSAMGWTDWFPSGAYEKEGRSSLVTVFVLRNFRFWRKMAQKQDFRLSLYNQN